MTTDNNAAATDSRGAVSVTGSEDAKRRMVLMLEAIAGVRTIQSTCTDLGIAATQYYALEARVLQAMVDALEPRKR